MANKIYPFNNNVETGLRMLVILTAAFPNKYDVDHMIYFDYMVVHSGDIDPLVDSLHPAVPNRSGEIFVRRRLIQEGLEIFIQKGLVHKYYNNYGIQYSATEISQQFIDTLSESYTANLFERAMWLAAHYSRFPLNELREIMATNLSKLKTEFNLEIIN